MINLNGDTALATNELAKYQPMRIVGRGSGSSSGGKSGGSATNDRNTKRSKARFRLVEVISEGPILGLVDGEKSIYFDQTPLLNDDGTYNFKGVIWHDHKGYADEGFFNGHSAVETTINVETQVKKSIGPVVRTIVDENADAVRVIVRCPSLVRQDDKGGLKTTNLSYAIDCRSYNGTWHEVLINDLQNEKALSPFQMDHRIDLPAGGSPWDIRIRRLTDDSNDDKLQNDLFWEGYVILVEGKFIYPNSAAIAMEGNAEEMGSSIPPRSYHVKGLLINVPSNYDPIARTYTGIWDGTFKIAWTNNPAWIFYDLLVNDRYGLGEFIAPEIVDKWSLYTIAQYCDQLVKSGYKNGDTGADILEPRFTYNGVINSRDEAYFVLQSITQAWRGMAYWAMGQVFASADMPADPVKLVSPANVIGGDFEYAGTALKARHPVVMVKWNNPDDFYRPDTEVVIDSKLLHKYGWREKSVQLRGCTSRGLAHRYGKWVIDTEQNETETVTYSASWDHAELRPGDIIAISDPRKAQIRAAGRVASHNDLTVTLDHAFEWTEGETYQLMLTMPSGQVETKPILAFLDSRTVRIASAFSAAALPNAMWTIKGSDITPRLYRVLNVEESEPNIFKITALFHDPTKFARVEDNVVFEPLPYERGSKLVSPPTNLMAVETGYVANGVTHHNITVSWSAPANQLVRGFVVAMDAPDGTSVTLGTTDNSYFELSDSLSGEYKFYVQTIGYTGIVSSPASLVFAASGQNSFPLPTVTDIVLTDRPTSNEFVGKDVRISWKNNFALSINGPVENVSSPHYSHNTVKVYHNNTNTLLRTDRIIGETYSYDYTMNLADSKAAGFTYATRELRFEVVVSDILGRNSVAATKVFSNPVPQALTPNIHVSGPTVNLGFVSLSDLDFEGVLVYRSTSPGVSTTGIPIYEGTNNPAIIPGQPETVYYYKMAAYDSFGKDELNWTSEFIVATEANYAFADVVPPETPTGLSLTTRTELANGIPARLVLVANIDPSIADDFATFNWEIKQGTGNYVAFPSNATTYEWTVNPNTTYTVRVKALDTNANSSPASIVQSIVTPDVPEIADQINNGSVTIDAGKIAISGATTLADWRMGGDETKIDGGNISANTIKANSVEIGLRNISLESIEFEHNKPLINSVSWTSGTISYVNDSGSVVETAISAGSAAWLTGTVFIYWTKGSNSLGSTTDANTAFASSNVVLASYRGGTDLNSMYGRTVIDGGKIKTGTVQAQQIAANAIDATKISVANLAAISATLGNVDISNANIGTLTVGTSNIGNNAVSSFVYSGGMTSGSVTIYHPQNTAFVLISVNYTLSANQVSGGNSYYGKLTVSGPTGTLGSASGSTSTIYNATFMISPSASATSTTITISNNSDNGGSISGTVSLAAFKR